MPTSLAERLRKAGIRHYDELIHDKSKDWLVKNFKAEGAAPKRNLLRSDLSPSILQDVLLKK